MLAVVSLIFGGFGLLLWTAVRRARRRAREGQAFQPEGKIRWPEDPALGDV